jgi:CheY-like chemotaxis protein
MTAGLSERERDERVLVAVAGRETAARPGSVVLVDENPRQRAITESSLTARGYRVTAVDDAADAVESVRRSRAEVVVLGLDDGSNTLDLIRRLRGRFAAIPLSPPPRIVVAAGEIDPGRERFTRQLGADIVLRWPFEPDDLVAAVRRLASV